MIDFLNITGQQKFKEEKNLNPIEIRIENDMVQNILEKYEKSVTRFWLEGILFSSEMKREMEEIFFVTTEIADAKYSLKNNSLY